MSMNTYFKINDENFSFHQTASEHTAYLLDIEDFSKVNPVTFEAVVYDSINCAAFIRFKNYMLLKYKEAKSDELRNLIEEQYNTIESAVVANKNVISFYS